MKIIHQKCTCSDCIGSIALHTSPAGHAFLKYGHTNNNKSIQYKETLLKRLKQARAAYDKIRNEIIAQNLDLDENSELYKNFQEYTTDRGDALRAKNKNLTKKLSACCHCCACKPKRYLSRTINLRRVRNSTKRFLNHNKKKKEAIFILDKKPPDPCICTKELFKQFYDHDIGPTAKPSKIASLKAKTLKRIFCECKLVSLSKNSVTKIKNINKNAREKVRSSLLIIENRFKIRKDSIALFKDKLKSKILGKKWECTPGWCIPMDCLPFECYEKIKLRDRLQNFASRISLKKLSDRNIYGKRLPIPRKKVKKVSSVICQCKPDSKSISSNIKTERIGYGETKQKPNEFFVENKQEPTGISLYLEATSESKDHLKGMNRNVNDNKSVLVDKNLKTPKKCSSTICIPSERSYYMSTEKKTLHKNLQNDNDFNKRRKAVYHKLPKEIINDTHLYDNLIDNKSRSVVRIGSTFSFNIEFYKEKNNRNRAKQKSNIISNTKSDFINEIKPIKTDRKYSLKRCFCSLKFMNKKEHPKFPKPALRRKNEACQCECITTIPLQKSSHKETADKLLVQDPRKLRNVNKVRSSVEIIQASSNTDTNDVDKNIYKVNNQNEFNNEENALKESNIKHKNKPKYSTKSVVCQCNKKEFQYYSENISADFDIPHSMLTKNLELERNTMQNNLLVNRTRKRYTILKGKPDTKIANDNPGEIGTNGNSFDTEFRTIYKPYLNSQTKSTNTDKRKIVKKTNHQCQCETEYNESGVDPIHVIVKSKASTKSEKSIKLRKQKTLTPISYITQTENISNPQPNQFLDNERTRAVSLNSNFSFSIEFKKKIRL
ncbi:hypothetical protein ACJJTC_008939 [Scirpophaga incertulas]